MTDESIPPLKFNEPLVFGNKEQLEKIRSWERSIEFRKTACGECAGEGEIVCPACDGSGQKRVK